EDVLAAGALCGLLAKKISADAFCDSAFMARELTRAAQPDLLAAVKNASNARRLLAIPELADDVAFCLRRDTVGLVAAMDAEGFVRKTA
ncbi:MAG: 2-phosphosulfolactate phosphatase, partial [Verrucomicrobia bacterium]|nr:2-phosphosulfolactate phosphatase [Verrucomicrobiota bacterium]